MKKILSALASRKHFAVPLISCSSSTEQKQDTDSPSQQASLYQCPMQCEGDKTYDKPGKCPVCGMDLKPWKRLPLLTAHTTTAIRRRLFKALQ
jgi:hypothetical protein